MGRTYDEAVAKLAEEQDAEVRAAQAALEDHETPPTPKMTAEELYSLDSSPIEASADIRNSTPVDPAADKS